MEIAPLKELKSRQHSVFLFLLLSWPFYLNDFYLIPLQGSDLRLLWSLDIIFFTLIPCTSLVWLYKKGHITKSHLALHAPFKISHIFQGLFLCALSVILVHWLLMPKLASYLPGGFFYGYPFPMEEPYRTATIMYASLSAALMEEWIFTGVLITLLHKHIKSTLALVIISSFIFSLIHWGQGPTQLVNTFLLSVLPSYWFVRTRQLWGNMIYHFSYDYILFSGLV